MPHPAGKIKRPFHARFDHLDRVISLDGVIYGIKRDWSFERPPEFNNDQWQWKYQITTRTVEEDPLILITAVNTVDRTFEVITKWKKQHQVTRPCNVLQSARR